MRRIIARLLILTFFNIAWLTGTAHAEPQNTIKNDAFPTAILNESEATPPLMPGYARLTLKMTYKTPPLDYFLLESAEHANARTSGIVELSIDEQTFTVKIDGKTEITPKYDSDGKWVSDGGKGIRFTMTRTMLVKPGTHTIRIRLKETDVTGEARINLTENSAPTVTFKADYKGGFSRRPDFTRGILKLAVQ